MYKIPYGQSFLFAKQYKHFPSIRPSSTKLLSRGCIPHNLVITINIEILKYVTISVKLSVITINIIIYFGVHLWMFLEPQVWLSNSESSRVHRCLIKFLPSYISQMFFKSKEIIHLYFWFDCKNHICNSKQGCAQGDWCVGLQLKRLFKVFWFQHFNYLIIFSFNKEITYYTINNLEI